MTERASAASALAGAVSRVTNGLFHLRTQDPRFEASTVRILECAAALEDLAALAEPTLNVGAIQTGFRSLDPEQLLHLAGALRHTAEDGHPMPVQEIEKIWSAVATES